MRERIIRPERRHVERRPSRLSALGEAVAESVWSDRRVQCWNLNPECDDSHRKRCPAYFVRRNCWDLWAAEYFPPGRRPCCRPDSDCSDCSVASSKFTGPISIYVATPPRADPAELSIEVCPSTSYCCHLYNSRDGVAGQRADAEVRSDFRCHRRPGILLHESYVSEVCSLLEHRDCVFYDTE